MVPIYSNFEKEVSDKDQEKPHLRINKQTKRLCRTFEVDNDQNQMSLFCYSYISGKL